MGSLEKLPKPQLYCEGWCRGSGSSSQKHEFCDGGPGVWVTRRARWIRNGYYQCGTCKRRDDKRLDENA